MKKYNEIKSLKLFCEGLDSAPNYREVLGSINSGEVDFEVSGVRFIHKDVIDEIQQEELLSDEYVLGCFRPEFLCDYISLEAEDIREMQQKEMCEALGRLASKHIKEIQAGYASADGYGHHFNHYDFGEEEFGGFYVFDNRI